MRLVILHYHIFKNAGSTIEDILDHSFGERFAKLDTPAGEGLISNPDLVRFFDARPSLRAFSSHQIRHPLPEAPGYLFFDICFLRDPIDRIRSIYTYFRQKTEPRRSHERPGQPHRAGRFHRRHDPGLSALREECPGEPAGLRRRLRRTGAARSRPGHPSACWPRLFWAWWIVSTRASPRARTPCAAPSPNWIATARRSTFPTGCRAPLPAGPRSSGKPAPRRCSRSCCG